MKKVFLLTLAVILTLSVSLALTACSDKKADESKDEENVADVADEDGEENDNAIVMATEAGYPPFEYVGEDGEIVGIDIDIMNEIAKKMDKELIVKSMSFDSALLAVENGKVDVVAAAVTVTEDRKEKMDFSDGYMDTYLVAIVNAENPAVKSTEKSEMTDVIVGVQQGSTADLWVSDKNNVDAKEIKLYEMVSVASMDLKQGKLDVIVMDKLPADEMIKQSDGALKLVDGDLFMEETALAFPKGKSTELREVSNEVIKELKESGKIDEFVEKHKEAEE